MKHYEPRIATDMMRTFNLKTGDMSSPDLSPSIVPTVDVIPDIVAYQNSLNSGASTSAVILAVGDKPFYVQTLQLSLIKDANATSTATYIAITKNGVAVRVIEIRGITLTAQSHVISITLPQPIRADPNTNINLACTTNVATFSCSGLITGFFAER